MIVFIFIFNLISAKTNDNFENYLTKEMIELIENNEYIEDTYNSINKRRKKMDDYISFYFDKKYIKLLKKNSRNTLNNKEYKKIINEAILSSIIYQKTGTNKKRLFYKIKNIKERIKLTIYLLLTVMKVETSAYNYSSSIWSPSNAFGRFQIVSHTAGEIFFYLLRDSIIKIEKKELNDFKNDKYKDNYPYYTIREIYKDYKKEYLERNKYGWSIKYRKLFLNKLVNYNKYFRYTFQKRYKQANNSTRKLIKENIKDFSYNKYGFIWDSFEKFILMYKDPTFQGLMALKTLETKEMYIRNNKSTLQNIKKILKLYNADHKLIIYKGRLIKTSEYYSIIGNDIFKKLDI